MAFTGFLELSRVPGFLVIRVTAQKPLKIFYEFPFDCKYICM